MQDGADLGEVKAHVRRRTFLVDRKFQFKWTAIIVSVGVLISAGLGFFIVKLTMDLNESLGIDEALLAEATRADSYAIYYLVGFVAVMAVALFVWGIFMTHRVAGPIFIISRYLHQIGQGEVPRPRPLRRGDDLQEFFETFSGMLAKLQERHLAEAALMIKAAAALRDKGGDAALVGELEQAAVAKQAWRPQA
jgi:hypothetical protein